MVQREVKLAQEHCGKVEIQTQQPGPRSQTLGLSGVVGNNKIPKWAVRK